MSSSLLRALVLSAASIQLFFVWKFQNEKDGPLVTNVPPTTVKEGYVKDNNKTYSEKIEYQTLYLKDSEKMRVTIDIKKCPTADCDRQQTKSKPGRLG